jgi:hypothetical protein
MVRTLRAELGTEHDSVKRVAEQLGYGIESFSDVGQAGRYDEGRAPGVFQFGVGKVA